MVACSKCGTEGGPNQKFCGECGSSLTTTCQRCDEPLTPNQKFCGSCGAQVAGPAVPEAAPASAPNPELRLVTVLFCDLEGHTRRSEELDPDLVRDLLTGYFDTARAIIEEHGGTVEKFIGDAVMAVWGVPVTLENDAERAVRAGLELVDAIAAYGTRTGVAGLRARVGVVTGRAAAVDGDDAIVVGDRVNAAARIQSLAEPGTVLVDAVTRETTSAAIAYRDAGLHALKGIADPVQVWRADRSIAGAMGANRTDQLEAHFVGRDSELRLVKDLFHAVTKRGTARLVSVVGPAGVGKSRLGWEFDKYADGLAATMWWHAGRCLSYGDGVAYWALAQMVRQRMGIGEQDPPDVAGRRLDQGLERWVPDTAEREFLKPRLAQLLGLPSATHDRDDLFGAWRLLFERLAEDAPVVLVVEDLHWADDGLLDFFDSLLDWSSRSPIFVLTFARPELAEIRPAWGQRLNGTSISLEPLDDESMHALLADLADLPDGLARRIVEQAEGIPLYAVEIVRSLIDQGVIQDVGGRRRAVGPVEELVVPATLTALLSARVDGLPPDERSILRDLAVLGTTFPRAAIEAVAQPTDTPIDTLLSSLVRRGVLTVLADPLSPDRGHLQFAQGLLRTVVYETLTRRERKARHTAVAEHLRRAFPDDAAEVAETVAAHYRDALDAGPDADDADDLRRLAAAAFRRAGDRAAGLGALAAATNAYREALALERDDGAHAELLLLAGVVADRSNRPDEAVRLFEQAIAEFTALDRPDDVRLSTFEMVGSLSNDGRADDAEQLLDVALAELRPDVVDEGATRLVLQRAFLDVIAGNLDDCGELIQRAIRMAEGLRDQRIIARSWIVEATFHLVVGNIATARVLSSAAVDLARRISDLTLLSNVVGNHTQVLMGDDEAPLELLAEAIALSRRLGHAAGISISTGNMCRAMVRSGDWDGAAAVARSTIDELGDQTLLPGTAEPLLWLAAVTAWRGDLAEAARLREQAEPRRGTDPQDVSICEAIIAMLSIAAGDLDGMSGRLVELVERDVGLGWTFDTLPFLWPAGIDVALATGDLASAERLIEMLDAVLPGHRPPYLAAELGRARARLTVARAELAAGVDIGPVELPRRFAPAVVADLAGGPEGTVIEAALRDTVTRVAALPLAVAEAETRFDLADWLRATDRAAEADEVAAPAVATARRLGAVRLLGRIDEPSTAR